MTRCTSVRGDWSDAQVKCGAWLIIYAENAEVVTGGDLRRYSFGVIRRNVHKMINEWRSTQPVTALPVPFERAIVSIVPEFTEAVARARMLFEFTDDVLLLDGEMLSGAAPDDVAVWAPAPPPEPVGNDVALSWERDFAVPPMGLPVKPVRILADFRVNLTVTYEDRGACEAAGGLFDAACGVLYMPPRVDLRPVEKWLPFMLDRPGAVANRSVAVSDDYAILTHNPQIPKAAGPIKADGSPNMSVGANIRVRDLLKPPTPMRSVNYVQHDELLAGVEYEPTPPAATEPPPAETEGVLIAAQLRAAAAAVAPMLAWIFAVTPSNVMVQAYRGDIVSQAVLSAFMIVLVSYTSFFVRTLRRMWGIFYRNVAHRTTIALLLTFIWMCVMKASASSDPSLATLQQRDLLSDIADRCGGQTFMRLTIFGAHTQ